MADYPGQLFDPRVIENMPGVVYDANKATVLFAEDLNATNDEVVAVETYLGKIEDDVLPQTSDWLQWFYDKEAKRFTGSISLVPTGPNPWPNYVTIPDSSPSIYPAGIPKTSGSVGYFSVRHLGQTKYYSVVISYAEVAGSQKRVYLTYIDVTARQIVAVPPYTAGDLITGDATLYYVLDWN